VEKIICFEKRRINSPPKKKKKGIMGKEVEKEVDHDP